MTHAYTTYTMTRLPSDGGVSLAVYEWAAGTGMAGQKPKAVVQIAHGMAEHARRYDHVAQALVRAGYAVYAMDHRGHGQSVSSDDELGFFAPQHGFRALVDDVYRLNRKIAAEHPGVKRVLFAHSMGSFVAQDFLFTHGDAIDAAVLSGTNSGGKPLVTAGLGLAHLERLRVGPRGTSQLLQKATFGDYNRRFKPTRTEYDWLSRDSAEVDKYIADPLCGFPMKVQGWIDVMGGLIRIDDDAQRARIPKQLPVYMFAGAEDPVGQAGKGVVRLAEAYKRAGLADVTYKLYPGARHEMVNEKNREAVIADLIGWLDAHV